ncbi:hypothetical protein BDR04DRAFT_477746 [Suillus decipiens]|nr:hypothetical protein BDR04DRAFT_477746 [Suillus decipiens]
MFSMQTFIHGCAETLRSQSLLDVLLPMNTRSECSVTRLSNGIFVGLDLNTSSLCSMYFLATQNLIQTLHKCSFRKHPITFLISSHPPCLTRENKQRHNASSPVGRTLLHIHVLTHAPLPILHHVLITALSSAYHINARERTSYLPHCQKNSAVSVI